MLRRITLRTAPVLASVVLLAACTSPDSPPAPDDGTSERRAAVVEARELVVDPAQHLGTAAATVAARLEDVVERPGADPVGSLREAVTDLEEAREEVASLDLVPATPDVEAAEAALDAARAGARRMAEASTVVATAADQASTADQALEDLVASWDEPGSRSELLARLDETALAADALAGDEVGAPPEQCPGPVESRVAAADFVADATRQLRELVEARDGDAFDARRAELADAPLGHDDAGTARTSRHPIEPEGCPAVDAARESAEEVTRALEDLQAALNPPDLSG